MPYIKKEDRKKFDKHAQKIAELASCAGDLNYALTIICQSYIKKLGLRYANINEVIGFLECAKLELYRKVAAGYEDQKADENGDVDLFKTPQNKKQLLKG